MSSQVLGAGFVVSAGEPRPPDFYHCDARYGRGLITSDCNLAANAFPRGEEAVIYVNDGGSDTFSLPQVRQHGDCTITLDYAYPVRSNPLRLTPNVVRALAAGVVLNCVMYGGGIGGFVTQGLVTIIEYLEDPGTNLSAPLPYERSLTTITVSGPDAAKHPGMLDPYIPLMLYSAHKEADGGNSLAITDPLAIAFMQMSSQVSSSKPWWDHVSEYVSDPEAARDEMAYKCDSNLGAPGEADCSQLEYSQLGPPSDAVEIGPGKLKLLLSKTCNVAISSPIPIQITWLQIGAALDALINICVANPLKSRTGGKAYYGAQGFSLTRRRKKKRLVSGLNALPPHVTLTLFQPGYDP